MALKVVVLAAGNGKRMFSVLPKVMHTIAGVPMLERVVRTAQKLDPDEIFVVQGSNPSGKKVRKFMDYLHSVCLAIVQRWMRPIATAWMVKKPMMPLKRK